MDILGVRTSAKTDAIAKAGMASIARNQEVTKVAASGLRGVIVTRHAKQNTGKQESKSELASANLQNMDKRRSWKSRKKFVIGFLVVTLAAMAAARIGRSGRSAPRPAEGGGSIGIA